MTKSIYKFFLSFVIAGFLFITFPIRAYAESLNNISSLFIVGQQKTILNYEKSQPSSIDNPVIDPNAMRANDAESSTATYIVIGLLVAATIIPLATWWYFSK